MKVKKAWSMLLVLVLAMGLLAGCGGSGGGTEDGVIMLKIAHTDSSSRSTHLWSEWLGEYLEEQAPGRFAVEVYPDGQLGDTPDLIAGVKLGTVTMAFDLSSVVSAAAGPEASCIDLPFLYPSYADWIEGTFENGGLELFNEALQDYGYYCIDMYYNGMRHVISSKKHYHNASDLNGQKVRIAQNELNVELWRAMGGNPTPMAWGEVITSLSQGQIDALDHSLGVFNDFSLHEIAPYITLTNHASSPFPVICSLEWIESLPSDLREILEEGVRQMCAQQRDEEWAKESEYIARFIAEGATVEELTADEVAAFREAVQPVYDMWRERIGDEAMDAWLATVPGN